MVVFKILVIISLIEILFRFFYFIINKTRYFVSLKLRWKDSYIVSHPFLSFSYKKNSFIKKNQKLSYPLHYNKFFSFKEPLKINNLGHFGEDFNLEKDKIRILCLGASTTANNISDGKNDYSYPKLLENYLNKKLKKEVEVFNCGIGGWTSVDIFINFILNLIQLSPDYVILYHGYNDLHLYLMDDFQSDYQHGRKNVGEIIHKVKLASFLPKIKFLTFYEFIKDKLFGTGNIRNDVLKMITESKIDYTNIYKMLSTQKNMIELLLCVCKYHDIKVVLSSFCYYDYEKTLESIKIKHGIDEENKIIGELRDKFNCLFVDQNKIIKKVDKNFVDCIHFTPKGMKLLSENFGKILVPEINREYK